MNTMNYKLPRICCNIQYTVQTVYIIYKNFYVQMKCIKNEIICLNFESIKDLRLSIDIIVVVYYYFSNL